VMKGHLLRLDTLGRHLSPDREGSKVSTMIVGLL
jgi:hypothetical protein